MQTFEKIARWAGQFRTTGYAKDYGAPDYSKDGEAVRLLPALRDKGYHTVISYHDEGVEVLIFHRKYLFHHVIRSSLAEAICASILYIIEMEKFAAQAQ